MEEEGREIRKVASKSYQDKVESENRTGSPENWKSEEL